MYRYLSFKRGLETKASWVMGMWFVMKQEKYTVCINWTYQGFQSRIDSASPCETKMTFHFILLFISTAN